MFWDVFAHFGLFWDVLGCFGGVLGCIGKFLDALGLFEGDLGRFGMFWDFFLGGVVREVVGTSNQPPY